MRFVAIAVVVVGLSHVALAQDKMPMPNVADVGAAEKLVKELFKAEYAKTKPADRHALATRLLDQANQPNNDAASKYVLLREARDVAAKAGDPAQALKAANELAQVFEMSIAVATAPVAETLASTTLGADAQRDLAEALLEAGDVAIADVEFDTAVKLLKAAETAAKKSKDVPASVAAASRAKSVATFKKDFDKIAEVKATLAKSPADPAANLTVGKFHCLARGDWAAGVLLLLKGPPGSLRSAAEKDVKAADGTQAEQTDAAETWAKVAGEVDPAYKIAVLARALVWHRKAASQMSGLTKASAERKIEELSKTVGPRNDPLSKWNVIRHLIREKRYKDAGIIGGAFAETTFRELPPDGAILIGFRYTLSNNFPSFMQGIYLTSKGEQFGIGFGPRPPTGQLQTVKAKPGFAVGAIFVRGGGGFDAFQPIFMRLNETGVDPSDKYESPLIGNIGGGTGTVGGDGRLIVGIHGKATPTGQMQALSVISLTEAANVPPKKQ